MPTRPQQELGLDAVSCSTPATCTAVGSYSVVATSGYNTGHPGPMGLVETFGFSLAPSIASADKTTFTAGQAGSFAVMATGYPLPAIAEKGKLPKGLSFTAGKGHATISGIARNLKKVHTYVIKIQASNSVKKNVTQSLADGQPLNGSKQTHARILQGHRETGCESD